MVIKKIEIKEGQRVETAIVTGIVGHDVRVTMLPDDGYRFQILDDTDVIHQIDFEGLDVHNFLQMLKYKRIDHE